MISLTISRDELALTDLVIDSNPFAGNFHVDEDGVEWPRFPTLKEYAPASRILGGRVKLAASDDLGVMAATIYAHADTITELLAAKAELDAAVRQFSYTVGLEVLGESVGTWLADPEAPSWGEIDSGMVRAFLLRATVTFTLHPGAI